MVQGRWGSTTFFHFFGEIQKKSILAVCKDFDLLVICIWKGLALDNLYDRGKFVNNGNGHGDDHYMADVGPL